MQTRSQQEAAARKYSAAAFSCFGASCILKNVPIGEDGTIKLHARLTGDGRIYSVDLTGKREGNTIKGNGSVVVRGPLNVPLDNRNVTWVTHFAGTR